MPARSQDDNKNDDQPASNSPRQGKNAVTRAVERATLPARLGLLSSTAEGLVDDLELLSQLQQAPPQEVVAAGRAMVGMARDLHAMTQGLADHPEPVTRSEVVENSRLLREACERFQGRIADLTMAGAPPVVADAVLAAGLAYQADLLHQLLARGAMP
jgi:hypothetical protein